MVCDITESDIFSHRVVVVGGIGKPPGEMITLLKLTTIPVYSRDSDLDDHPGKR